MTAKRSSLIFVIFFTYTLSGCVFGKLTFSDGKNWIPKDFYPHEQILLIQEYPINETTNKAMVAYLNKNYRGQFIVARKEEILDQNGKYADTKIYQFAFLWDTKNNDGTEKNINAKPIGYFYDRILCKSYSSTMKANRYKPTNAYKSYINTIDVFYKKR